MPLDLQLRPAIALNLHKEVFTSLASGDIKPLRPMLCSGLVTKFQSQINYRRESNLPTQSWKIIRYTSPIQINFSRTLLSLHPYFWPLSSLLPGTQAKIVSDRAVPFPMGKDIYIRQCIVRIRSLQSLNKNDGTPSSQADLTEYLVMQQMKTEEDQPATWKMWGTTKPATKEELDELVSEEASGQKMTLMDRLKAADPTRGF